MGVRFYILTFYDVLLQVDGCFFSSFMHGGSFDTSAYQGSFFISSVTGVAPWLNNHFSISSAFIFFLRAICSTSLCPFWKPVGIGNVDRRQLGIENERYVCCQHIRCPDAQGFQQFVSGPFLRIDTRQIDQPAYPPVIGSFYNGSVFHGLPHKRNAQILAIFLANSSTISVWRGTSVLYSPL